MPDDAALSDRAREEFLAEAQELIERIAEDLSALDARAGDPDPEAVNALFRSVHTLKGLAGTFSAGGLARLAHALEEPVDRVRMGRAPFDLATRALLARAVDHMEACVARARAGVAPDDAAAERVVRALRGDPAREASRAPSPGLDPALLAALTEYEEHRLRASLVAGASLWRVRTGSPLDALDRTLAEVRALAQPLGEVISFVPGAMGDDDHLALDVLLTSAAPDDAVRAALESPSRRVEPVPTSPGAGLPLPREAPAPEPPPEAALRSVRVDIRRLDQMMALVGELSRARGAMGGLVTRAGLGDDPALRDDLARVHGDLGRRIEGLRWALIEARMVPLGQVFERLAREVRNRARLLGRAIRFVATGADTTVDKLVVEELAGPLLHVVRNAIDHGIEAPAERAARAKPPDGTVAINAWQEGARVVIEVEDDGAGVDVAAVARSAVRLGMLSEEEARGLDRAGAMALLFRAGFSTREAASDTSGRGVGLDVVRAHVARVAGAVEIVSEVGVYTKVTLTVPVTLAVPGALD